MSRYRQNETAEQRARRRARKRRLYRIRQRIIECCVLALLITVVVVPIRIARHRRSEPTDQTPTVSEPLTEQKPVFPEYTAQTVTLTDEVDADYALLMDVTDNRVLAAKDADVRTYPASVTKVMTLLVAVENITDFTETFTVTYALTDPLYLANATVAGFSNNEAVTMEDLLYGTILPSGADACQALALHVAGTDEAFVAMMNERARKMGLKNTHFTNTSGLHDRDHYTTAEDMAVILRTAMENEHCRQVLSTYQYTTSSTPQHPEGILLTSTLFSRMYGTEPDGATVVAGKTGYTTEAGHTVVSYAEGLDGHDYILVTLKGSNRWKATSDAINLYTEFSPLSEKTDETSNPTS